ncbi:CC0125/CC1285 family lipoprotein [Hirschia maritima]|uniref:CC0125/CC1285 family lipoprotein n=1 Tax=Hirschia maritima TaxID=1121961 RepID=UPI000476699A|nr:hypothetical protein [Hirschia maritima]
MRKSFLVLLTASALTIAACATQPAYRPASSYNGAGYSEQIIESNRFRVSFKGSSTTPRDEVETFLLLRAAELTLENGFDYFVVVDRETETKSRSHRHHGFGGYYSRYGFGYSYFYPRAGWYGAYDPFWDRHNYGYNQITKYEASAEIMMHAGEKPDDELRAFDAREVVKNIGPNVTRP